MFFISLSQRVTCGGTSNGVEIDETTADSTQTQRLLEQVQTGDSTAFERLFARHQDYLRRIIEMRMDRQLRSRFDASDVLQETHLEVSERLQEYLARRAMPFRLWLRKTAHQRLLRMRRAHAEAQNRALSREVPLPHRSSVELAQQLLGTGTTPSEQIGRRELARCVRAAMGQLAEADREMLLMRNFEGLTVREVGCILDLDPGTVSRLHGKALMRLAKILLESGFTESQL
ncbi:MAG: sigma-70 family RNA polymerase sigma factor [Phycisphaerae bacterium]